MTNWEPVTRQKVFAVTTVRKKKTLVKGTSSNVKLPAPSQKPHWSVWEGTPPPAPLEPEEEDPGGVKPPFHPIKTGGVAEKQIRSCESCTGHLTLAVSLVSHPTVIRTPSFPQVRPQLQIRDRGSSDRAAQWSTLRIAVLAPVARLAALSCAETARMLSRGDGLPQAIPPRGTDTDTDTASHAVAEK